LCKKNSDADGSYRRNILNMGKRHWYSKTFCIDVQLKPIFVSLYVLVTFVSVLLFNKMLKVYLHLWWKVPVVRHYHDFLASISDLFLSSSHPVLYYWVNWKWRQFYHEIIHCHINLFFFLSKKMMM
jgi:hypothetical protein